MKNNFPNLKLESGNINYNDKEIGIYDEFQSYSGSRINENKHENRNKMDINNINNDINNSEKEFESDNASKEGNKNESSEIEQNKIELTKKKERNIVQTRRKKKY